MPTPRSLKEGVASHQGLVAVFLSLIIVFQVAFQYMAHSALRGQKDDVWSLCADGTHGASNSLQCAEVELFRSWQDAASDDDTMLLRASPDRHGSHQDAAASVSTDVGLVASTTETQRKGEPVEAELKLPEAPHDTPIENIPGHEVEPSNVSSWAQGLIDLQASLQSQMDHLPIIRERHPPRASAATSATSWSNETAWAKDLEALQASFESQMLGLHDAHKRLSHETAKRTKPLLDSILDAGHQLCSEPERRDRPECAKFRKAFINGSSSEPTRSSLRANRMAELDGRLHELEEKEHAWEKDFASKAVALAAELCKDPSRKSYAVCTEFAAKQGKQEDHSIAERGPEAQDAARPSGRRSALRGSSERQLPSGLHWTKVAAWKSSADNLVRQPPVLASNVLRHAHWSGTIPKVACIAVIPCGRGVKPWIKYFIDNFATQSYEGPRQLVIVYHYQHHEAARMVKTYADGNYIKGVPARDPEYPSASTFRFGAWNADADVIARWDFDAWHHSHRLSMQVRALAFADRPACLLKQWSVRNADGDLRVVSGGRNWDSSLVGEAAWMREHWYPSMDEGRTALEADMGRYVVNVDEADLSVYDEVTHEKTGVKCDHGHAVATNGTSPIA